MKAVAGPLVLLVLIGGCGKGAPPQIDDLSDLAEDSVAQALALFDEAAFDTLAWESASAAQDRGGVVFRFSCEKCHGPEGQGDGGFVTGGDTLRPPSFHPPDWRFANDVQGLRKQIFTGTSTGMPHWGMEGLNARDIDAVARYITEVLRAGGP